MFTLPEELQPQSTVAVSTRLESFLEPVSMLRLKSAEAGALPPSESMSMLRSSWQSTGLFTLIAATETAHATETGRNAFPPYAPPICVVVTVTLAKSLLSVVATVFLSAWMACEAHCTVSCPSAPGTAKVTCVSRKKCFCPVVEMVPLTSASGWPVGGARTGRPCSAPATLVYAIVGTW